MNGLPDSSFLYIEPGGAKDRDGNTLPRSLRHFPVKDASGAVDMAHLRNAMAMIPQSNIPDAVKASCTAKAEKMLGQGNRQNAELETVDLDGVEILSTGGPIHGKGSPPAGDYWKPEDLRAMAEADAALHGELNPTAAVNPPANKVGHVEQPAVGYLENLRVDKTGTRLLADVKRVPKKLGELIRSGAYRARSVELSKVTSQETGKTYEWVVTGLAWLGARLPAVRTLDDVVALYEDGEVETRLVVEYGADGEEPTTERDEMLTELRNEIRAEVRVALEDALPGKSERPADTRPMPDLNLNEDAQRSLASALGLEGDITAESLLAAANAKSEAPAAIVGDQADVRAMAEAATKRAEATEQRLNATEKRHFITTALGEGRFQAGQSEHIEKMYDADEEACRAYVATLEKDETLAREFGSDENSAEETE